MNTSHFDLSGTIAMFIASALQHPMPRCNSLNKRMSTILVEQHKNKFNQVVVYCTLAHTSLVEEKWTKESNDGPPTSEFVQKCLFHDACVYRNAYRKMMFLVPQHTDIILSRPDHKELLFDHISEALLSLQANPPHMKGVLSRWGVDTLEEFGEKLKKVYA